MKTFYLILSLLFFVAGYAEIGHGQVIALDDSSSDLDFVSKTAFNILDSILDDNISEIKTEEEIEKHAKMREYHRLMLDASSDSESFLLNPINEYVLTKRLAEWNDLLFNTPHSHPCGNSSLEFRKRLPNKGDVNRAALSLLRLQITYRLNSSELAEGILVSRKDIIVNKYPMNAGECFEMGRHSYFIGEDDYANSWFSESLRKHEIEGQKTVPIEDILQYYAFSSFNKGQMELATQLTNRIIQILPQRRSELAEMYKKAQTLRAAVVQSTGQEEHDETYKSLCRGEHLMDEIERSKLYCNYAKSKSAFLRLQPVKQEVISLQPKIVIYHDIISDEEIETIKYLAKPKLEPIEPTNAYTNRQAENSVLRRVGNGTRLNATENPILKRITRRLQHLTGLFYPDDCIFAKLQVLTYGIGGHFSPHCDFIRNETTISEKGNILATLTLYLNDVEMGGSTVFPIAKARVPPKKGSAAFWFNLHANGEGNLATYHASCPVLIGFKWLAVQFFGSRQQEFVGQTNLLDDDSTYHQTKQDYL